MKIKIVGRDKVTGDVHSYIKMSRRELAQQLFDAMTHDEIHQDLNWELIVDDEKVDWHYPPSERQ